MSHSLRVLCFCILFASCASVSPSPSDSPPFQAKPLSEGLYQVELNMPGVAPAAASMMAMCASARLAHDNGYAYFRIFHRDRVAEGVGTYRLELSNDPKPEYPIVDPSTPGNDDTLDEEDFYVSTEPAVMSCKRAGFDPYETKQ